MAKSVKLDFSKFFPSDQSFVVVKANATHGDDFYVNLSFGDGDNKVQYWINEYNTKESLKQMQAMIEAMEKAFEFTQKALSLPHTNMDWLESVMLDQPLSEPKKPVAKKKKADPKK